jgi:hypothetical protein
VGSVVFDLSGQKTHQQTENLLPYALFGGRTNYAPWTPEGGFYSLTATPYSTPRQRGAAGAPYSINFTVNGPTGCTTAPFAPVVEYPGTSGVNRLSIVTNDFNGDGMLDLAVTNSNLNSLTVRLGNGKGSFGNPATFAVEYVPFCVVSGDFNRDGKQDLAVVNQSSYNVAVLLGTGTGSFGEPTHFAVGGLPTSLCTADFDGDGAMDLAVANNGSDDVSVLLGDGKGKFGAATNFPVGSGPQSITAGEFNGDGALDLAVTNVSSQNVSILLGDGKGSFGSATNFATGSYPYSILTEDFNSDGALDLAIANYSTDIASVLLGDGKGGFSPVTVFPGNFASPQSITAGDFNGDGKLDLALSDPSSGKAFVLMGDGNGGFGPPARFAAGTNPQSIAVGDFNADGKPDLAVGTDAGIGVLLNTCNAAVPLLTKAGKKSLPIAVDATGPRLFASPNPVTVTTRIGYSLPVEAQVRINIYDALGREVGAVFSGVQRAGTHLAEYNMRDLPSGVYTCRLLTMANGKYEVHTLKLVKTE